MTALVWRDLTLAARRPGLICALGLYAAVNALFLHVWRGAGVVPVLPGANLSEQVATVQRALVLVMAPWIAARIAGTETRDDVSRMSLLLNVPVSAVVRARMISVFFWALLFVLAGVPSAVLAQQMSAATPADMLRGQVLLVAVTYGAALLAVAAGRWTDSGVARWGFAAAIMVAAAFATGRI